MNAFRRHLQLGTWLALVAMLALALLPTVSHALAGEGRGFAEICTPQGMKVLALTDGEQPSTASVHLEHCPYCTVGPGDVAPPPPAPQAMAALAVGFQATPPLFGAAPRRLFAWALASPRAPPSRL